MSSFSKMLTKNAENMQVLVGSETYSKFMQIIVNGNCIVAFKLPFLVEEYYLYYDK